MPGPVSVECPKCGAKLKLKDRSKLGKKAACPKCKKPFVLTAPPDEDEFDDFDEFGDMDEYGEEEYAAAPAPRPRSASASRKSSGKKKKRPTSTSSGGGKIALFVGGGVAALLLLVGVGLWAAGVFSGGEDPGDQPVADGNNDDAAGAGNKIDLAWLPADAELIVSLKVADAWQAPLLASFVNNPNMVESIAEMQQAIGLVPSDVESITAGLSGLSDQAGQAMEAGNRPNVDPAELAFASRKKLVAAVRTKKAVDAKSFKLLENGCEKVDLDGKTYYRFQPPMQAPQGPPVEPNAVFLAGPKLVVIGTEEKVKSVIASGGKQTRRKDLDFIDPRQQLLIVLVPRDRSKLTSAISQKAADSQDPGAEFAALAAKNLKAVCIGVTLGSGIDVQVQADCTNQQAASEIQEQLDDYIAEGRKSFEESKAELPPVLASAIDQVLGSLKTTSRSGTVTASASVSNSTIASLQQSAEELMPMVMAHMMGGGNVVPPGGTATPGGATPPTVNLPTEAPEGIEVTAIARWSQSQSYDAQNNKLPPNLQLWVYLIGRQPQKAIAWGNVQIDEVTAAHGDSLKPEENRSPYAANPTNTFRVIDRDATFGNSNHPQHGVRAVLSIPHPAKPVSTIGRASGSVALQVAGEQKTVTLKDVQSLAGESIDDPVLKQAGLKLEVEKQNRNLKLNVVEGNSFTISAVQPVDGAGEPLKFVTAHRIAFGNQNYFQFFLNNNVPADMGVKLTVSLDVRQVDVPFDVSNIRVPLPPDDPGAPSTKTAGIPDDLTLGGRTRWSGVTWTDPQGNRLPPSLDVLVTMLGDPAERAVSWGFVKVSEVKGPNGLPMKLNMQQFLFGGDPTKEFLRIERDNSNQNHPPDGVRAVFTLEHPGQEIQEMAVIDGSLKLRVAREMKDVTIANIDSLAGKAVTHPDLRVAGLRFKLERENTTLKLTLVGGDSAALGEVEVVDDEGKPLERVNVFRHEFSDQLFYRISAFGQKLPPSAALKLTVRLGLSELDVPFRFENVSVPDPPIP